MKALGVAIRLLMACCMLLCASGHLQAQQEQQTNPYQPVTGQKGKDLGWVPTAPDLVNKMLDMAKVTPQDFVIDLGSGDGRIVIEAAKRGARALGIEYDPNLVELSKVNAAKQGVSDKATFMKADLFETDLSKATVITMFLVPQINLKLRPKLLELKPGTRLVSNSYDMGDWLADETAGVNEPCEGLEYNPDQVDLSKVRTTWCQPFLFFWIIPAEAAGKWQLSGGELALTQKYQMLTGTLTLNGKNMPISDAKMIGDQITFNAGGTVYTGRLTGAVMEGMARTNGSSGPWRATRAEK